MGTGEMILLFAGTITFPVASIWLLWVSFRERFWWGMGCLLLPPVQLVFVCLHPEKALKPFALMVVSEMMLLYSGTALFQARLLF